MTPPQPRRTTVDRLLNDHRSRIRALEALPPLAQYEIKVFSDIRVVRTGDGAFFWPVPEDLDEWYLVRADAGVSTVSSSGNLLIQINNTDGPGDMLSSRIRIDAGEKTSYTSAVPTVILEANSQVSTGDFLRIDVDTAGTGAKGLCVIVRFSPALR